MNYTTAKVIADTVNPKCKDARITTFEVYAPRYLLAEVNTHGVLAKSAASSRAIPVGKRIEMVENEPYIPDSFGKNCPGMQSKELLEKFARRLAHQEWMDAINDALKHARKFKDLETHKQFANRVLEPYVYYKGVMTATELDNFWWLRLGADADPGFQVLAQKMKEACDASVPVARPYHLPYITDEEIENATGPELVTLLKASSARCARVSYVSLETGKTPTLQEDLQLLEKLTKPTGAHLSPFDHAAMADHIIIKNDEYYWRNPESHGRFWGWIPYRNVLEQDLGIKCRRSSFDAIKQL